MTVNAIANRNLDEPDLRWRCDRRSFLLLFFVERTIPARAAEPLPRRLDVDLVVSALAIGVAVAVVRPAANMAMETVEVSASACCNGLLCRPCSPSSSMILLLDVSFYLWHLANHRYPPLGLHVVHHIDRISMCRRHSVLIREVALSADFGHADLLIGASPLTIAIYELAFRQIRFFSTAMCACRFASSRF